MEFIHKAQAKANLLKRPFSYRLRRLGNKQSKEYREDTQIIIALNADFSKYT